MVLVLYIGDNQPPLGGCVLKLQQKRKQAAISEPAAFRRLCVETHYVNIINFFLFPAAFRRLCVETGLPMAAAQVEGASRL